LAKRFLLVGAALLALGVFAGCGWAAKILGHSEPSGDPDGGGRIVRFGIAQLGTGNAFVCDRPRGIRAEAFWIVVPWSFIEPQPDAWNFDLLDETVEAVGRCGLDLGIKLRTGRDFWGVEPGGTPEGRGSRPPRDLSAYRRWVETLVGRYRGRVRAYAIENEVNARSFWDAPYEAYEPVWEAGYRAVKAADPDALVLDFGMTSPSYGIAIARWRYEQGDLQGAIDWFNRYFRRRGRAPIRTEEQLREALSDPKAQSDYEILFHHLTRPDLYDAYQIHFYEPWELLPELLAWLRDRMREQGGGEKPIEAWELGYAWHDERSYDPERHGRDTTKLLVTALGEGVERVYYLPYASVRARQGRLETVRGLVDPDDRPRPAYYAYREAATRLAGFQEARRVQAGPDEWVYAFDGLLVRWTQDGEPIFEGGR